jgi:hypothetical protein
MVLTSPTVLLSRDSTTNNLCFGDSLGSIVVSTTGGTPNYTYSWSTGAITNTVNNLPAGNYDLTVTDDNGCVETASYTLMAPSTLATSVTASANGTATVVAQGGTNPYTYSWDNNANAQTTSTATNLTSNVWYEVTVTDANGCTAVDSILYNYVFIPAITNAYNISVYPNPASNQFFVELDFDQPKVVAVQLTSLLGQVVLEQQLGVISSQTITLTTSQLPAGVYWVAIAFGQEEVVQKIVIQ